VESAIRWYGKAIETDPRLAAAHNGLGLTLRLKGDADGALRCFRRAIELDPNFAQAHNNLGVALVDQGDVRDASRCFRKAAAIDPRADRPLLNLGTVLRARGDRDGAIACYRRAVEIAPKDADAHRVLGLELLARGQFAQARQVTWNALNLLPAGDPLRRPAAQQLRQCETVLVLNKKLPAVLEGKARPADAAEALALAQLCQQPEELHTAAVNLYTTAFAADPRLADDLEVASPKVVEVAPVADVGLLAEARLPPQYRYRAACSAALAGCGKGRDADKLDPEQRARLRQQALTWLHADLDAWRKRLANARPAQMQAILRALRQWHQDPGLAGVRGERALADLPGAERQAWKTLWADATALHRKANALYAAVGPAVPAAVQYQGD
jgi:Flp pilus assembly protein TadD